MGDFWLVFLCSGKILTSLCKSPPAALLADGRSREINQRVMISSLRTAEVTSHNNSISPHFITQTNMHDTWYLLKRTKMEFLKKCSDERCSYLN